MKKEAIIIGSGPIGNYLGFLLSKKGIKTDIYDKKAKIGLPVQCTGILTESIKGMLPERAFRESINNVAKKARIAAGNHVFEAKTKNYIIDRQKFDLLLAGMAKSDGAKIHLGNNFLGIRKNRAVFENGSANFTHLAGCDGPKSPVRKYVDNARVFSWTAYQARAKIKNLETDVIEFFPSIGTYAWIVPESDRIARIGAVAKDANVLRRLLKEKNAKPIGFCGGIIPKYNPKLHIQKNNIFICGDAATQVKATTGGGIIPGMTAAKLAAESICRGTSYEKEFRKTAGRELMLHLRIRNILDNFNQKDYERLIDAFNNPELKKIIEHDSRDNLLKAMPKLILQSHRLAFVARRLL